MDIAQVMGVKLDKGSVQPLIMAISLFKSICLKQWEMPGSHCGDISCLLFSPTIDTHRIMMTRLILIRAALKCLRLFEHRWPSVMSSSSPKPPQSVLRKTRRTIQDLSQDRTQRAKHIAGSTDPSLMRTWETQPTRQYQRPIRG